MRSLSSYLGLVKTKFLINTYACVSVLLQMVFGSNLYCEGEMGGNTIIVPYIEQDWRLLVL